MIFGFAKNLSPQVVGQDFDAGGDILRGSELVWVVGDASSTAN
jgi:hypothetical protein